LRSDLIDCARARYDHGLSAESVTAVRYLLIIAVATGLEIFKGWPEGISTSAQLMTISIAATILIVLPTFALQVGVARTAPLTAQVVRALGPVCVFALQQYDHRLTYSWPTLACILAYSTFAIAANVVHGWRERPAVMVATAGVPARTTSKTLQADTLKALDLDRPIREADIVRTDRLGLRGRQLTALPSFHNPSLCVLHL
jgi:hypothetical protein